MEKKKIVSLLRTFICLFFFEIKVLLWSGCAPFCRPWYDGWRVDSSSFIVRWKPDIHATSFTNSLTSWELFFCCLPFEWCCGVVCGSICLKWQTVTVSLQFPIRDIGSIIVDPSGNNNWLTFVNFPGFQQRTLGWRAECSSIPRASRCVVREYLCIAVALCGKEKEFRWRLEEEECARSSIELRWQLPGSDCNTSPSPLSF